MSERDDLRFDTRAWHPSGSCWGDDDRRFDDGGGLSVKQLREYEQRHGITRDWSLELPDGGGFNPRAYSLIGLTEFEARRLVSEISRIYPRPFRLFHRRAAAGLTVALPAWEFVLVEQWP
jgi:hypothetical protein